MKLGNFTSVKKYTKKHDARAELFCLSKPIAFLTFSSPSPSPSPSSLLKLPNNLTQVTSKSSNYQRKFLFVWRAPKHYLITVIQHGYITNPNNNQLSVCLIDQMMRATHQYRRSICSSPNQELMSNSHTRPTCTS